MTDAPGTAPVSPSGRIASVPLSPFWNEPHQSPLPSKDEKNSNDNDDNNDNEAIGSPRVAARGVMEVPMELIAFFPLPLDDCDSDERALPPEKRPSRKASTSRPFCRLPSVVKASEAVVEEMPPITQSEADTTSLSSDASVGSTSVNSEFSENTAGSKLTLKRCFFKFDLFVQ
jgi:hypothetical protein